MQIKSIAMLAVAGCAIGMLTGCGVPQDEHDAIVEAMAKKDADLAARLMEEHLIFVESSLSFNKKIPTHDISMALS